MICIQSSIKSLEPDRRGIGSLIGFTQGIAHKMVHEFAISHETAGFEYCGVFYQR